MDRAERRLSGRLSWRFGGGRLKLNAVFSGLESVRPENTRNFDAGPFNGHRRSGNFCAGRFDCKVQTMRVDSCKGLAMNKLPTRLDRVVRESNLWQRFRVAEFGSNQANPVPSRFFSVDERT